jgi:hypothetical protein
MRVGFVLLLLAGVAHADVSLPATRAEPKWIAECAAHLEAAQKAAAAELPIFALAHVSGADLYLDESILGSVTPVLFEAYVVERNTQWSDPNVTVRRWTASSTVPLGVYRQSAKREASLVAYQLDRWLTRAQQGRAIDLFERALDDCLRE